MGFGSLALPRKESNLLPLSYQDSALPVSYVAQSC